MKAKKRNGSNKNRAKKAILLDPRDIVLEAVDEALIPQAVISNSHKTKKK